MFGQDIRRKTGGINDGRSGITPVKARMSEIMTPVQTGKRSGRTTFGQPSSRSMSLGQPGARRTSLFQKPSTTIRDVKGLFNSNISKIHNFLLDQEGEDAPEEKMIRSPKGRSDFAILFELIYQNVSNQFELAHTSKLEEVIPPLFKSLGYPIALKNSHFQPMGSNHGYPYLIDAVAWLVDFVQMYLNISVQEIFIGDVMDSESIVLRSGRYSFMNSQYREFMMNRGIIGQENYLESAKLKLRNWYENQEDVGDQVEAMKNALEQINSECAEIKADKGKEEQYLEDLRKYDSDIRAAEEYKKSVEVHLETTMKNMKKFADSLEEKQNENQQLLQKIEDIKKQIRLQQQNHGLSGDGARKLKSEMIRDGEMLREIQQQLEEDSKQIWNMSERNKKAFKEQIIQFSHTIGLLKNLASGLNISADRFKLPANELELQTAIEDIEKVSLPEIKDQLNEKRLTMDLQLSRLRQNEETVKERIEIENEKIMEMQKAEDRSERSRRRDKQNWKEERAQLEKKLDMMENEREVLMENVQEAIQLDSQIREEKENCDKLEEKIDESMEELVKAVNEKVSQMVVQLREMKNSRLWMTVKTKEVMELIEKKMDKV